MLPNCQKLGTILLNKFPWEWFMIKVLSMKVVLLISIQIRKSFSWRSNGILASKILSENLKCLIFDSHQSKGLTRYQKILFGGSFKCKNLLKIKCTTEKFHNCHYTTMQATFILEIDTLTDSFRQSTILQENIEVKLQIWNVGTNICSFCKLRFSNRGKNLKSGAKKNGTHSKISH